LERISCMAIDYFDDSWKFWIWDNVRRGSPKRELANILLSKGFSETLILNELRLTSISDQKIPTIDFNRLTQDFGAEKLSDSLNIFKIKNVLTKEECCNIIEVIKDHCKPSTTIDYVNGGNQRNDFRTSSTANLYRKINPAVGVVEDAILKVVGIPERYSEQVQGQYYQVGQEFKPHFDTLFPNNDQGKKELELRGNRTWTAMVYLNDTPKGGHTKFTEIGIETVPEMGTMILWQNTENGENIKNSKHWGMPVEEGEKFILTKWFREKEYQNIP
jgi:prolyl 4-hydroxylase